MTFINGDYGKNLNKDVFFNNNKKADETKKAEVKETIDLTGAKYLGEKTDLDMTAGGVYGKALTFSGVGKTQQMFNAALNNFYAEFPKAKTYLEQKPTISTNVNDTYAYIDEAFNFMA